MPIISCQIFLMQDIWAAVSPYRVMTLSQSNAPYPRAMERQMISPEFKLRLMRSLIWPWTNAEFEARFFSKRGLIWLAPPLKFEQAASFFEVKDKGKTEPLFHQQAASNDPKLFLSVASLMMKKQMKPLMIAQHQLPRPLYLLEVYPSMSAQAKAMLSVIGSQSAGHQMNSGWAKAASIRVNLVGRLKTIPSPMIGQLRLLKAIRSLSISRRLKSLKTNMGAVKYSEPIYRVASLKQG